MTRASSPDSSSTAASHITVDMDASSQGRSGTAASPTPMTSLAGTGSAASLTSLTSSKDALTLITSNETLIDAKPDDSSRRRSGRARLSLPSYNLNILSGTVKPPVRPGSRNVSGDTLVEEAAIGKSKAMSLKQKKSNASFNLQPLLSDGIRALDLDWSVDSLPGDGTILQKTDKTRSRRSHRIGVLAGRVGTATAAAGARVKDAATALGKRGRDALASATEARADESGPARKRSKLDGVEGKSEPEFVKPDAPRPRKKYLASGLYVGMNHGFDPRLSEEKNRARGPKSGKEDKADELTKRMRTNKTLPLPMFAGESLLDIGRHFKLPFDVFCPLPRAAKPEEWKKTSRNYFIDDAASLWKKTAQLPISHCTCPIPAKDDLEKGCGDDCHNRHMMYECDDDNCRLGEACSNRSYTELKQRVKKGNMYDIGVEVFQTSKKGYGVRAMRSFEPGQIIVEYTGEIVTLEEMERRMRVDYKDNECYYMMEFHNGMFIDATRGSMARFVNHSCEPNCEMVKWVVSGQPRMALFAGPGGIVTGEELTYDYNFQNFAETHQTACHCGTESCRGILGPRSKDAPSKREAVTENIKQKVKSAVKKPKTFRNGKTEKVQLVAVKTTKAASTGTKPKQTKRKAADVDDDDTSPPAKRHKAVTKAKAVLARASSIKLGRQDSSASKTLSSAGARLAKAAKSTAIRSTLDTKNIGGKARVMSGSSAVSTSTLLTKPASSGQGPKNPLKSPKRSATANSLTGMRETMRRFLQQPEQMTGSTGAVASASGGNSKTHAVAAAPVTEKRPRQSTSSARSVAVGVVRTLKGRRQGFAAPAITRAPTKKSMRVVVGE